MGSLNRFMLSLIVLVLFSLTSCQKKEQEMAVTENEVPQEVLQVFNQAYPGAIVKEYTKEIEEGHTFYEISCEFEGRKIDAIYKPDGSVAAIEEIISAEELPEIVNELISKKFEQFSLELVEMIDKEDKKFFEVELLDPKTTEKYELLFSNTGELIKKEKTED